MELMKNSNNDHCFEGKNSTQQNLKTKFTTNFQRHEKPQEQKLKERSNFNF